MNYKNTLKPYLLLLVILLAGCTSKTQEIKDIKTLDDIRTARIGVVLGTTHDAFLTQEMTNAEIIRVESFPDLMMALESHKCDVIYCDHINYVHVRDNYPGIREIDTGYPLEHFGIAFNKENPLLVKQFNRFLKTIRENGLYQEMIDRWIYNASNADIPYIYIPTTGEPLRVAVAGTFFPFSFVKEQELSGFDVEIMMHFASYIKRPIELQSINFGSLIAALQAGKADIISSALSITEERKKMVIFSDPYFDSETIVATLPPGAIPEMTFSDYWKSIKESFVNNIIAEDRYMLIFNGMKTTIIISIFSILLGTLLGALICYMRMSSNTWLRKTAMTYITLMRGMPVLVLLMMMFYVFLADVKVNAVQVAIITFALNFSAYVCEMFRTAIQGVDRGQTEAGIALGFSSVQTFYHIIMPQAVKNVLPVYKGEMISLIKMTSIVGYIAVEDLTKMSDIIRSRTFDAFFPLVMVAILYFLLAWIFGKALDLFNPKQQPE